MAYYLRLLNELVQFKPSLLAGTYLELRLDILNKALNLGKDYFEGEYTTFQGCSPQVKTRLEALYLQGLVAWVRDMAVNVWVTEEGQDVGSGGDVEGTGERVLEKLCRHTRFVEGLDKKKKVDVVWEVIKG